MLVRGQRKKSDKKKKKSLFKRLYFRDDQKGETSRRSILGITRIRMRG